METKEIKETTLKLSSQAVGAIMMAVSKGLVAAASDKSDEECDITALLMDFELECSTDGLLVTNPPAVEIDTQ